jgi:Glycosyl transferase family 2
VTPFYRVTNFAKYSAANVPGSDTSRYRSYLTETAYSAYKPEPREGIEERVEAALRAVGLVEDRPPVASIHVKLSILMPVFNEGGVIREVVDELDSAIASRFGRAEIVAVDGASTEESAWILDERSASHPRLHVEHARR